MLPVLVDDDAAVARPDHGLPIGAEAPARHRVERHQAAPHPHGLGLVRRENRQRESEDEGESDGGRTVLHDQDSWLCWCRYRIGDHFRVPPVVSTGVSLTDCALVRARLVAHGETTSLSRR